MKYTLPIFFSIGALIAGCQDTTLAVQDNLQELTKEESAAIAKMIAYQEDVRARFSADSFSIANIKMDTAQFLMELRTNSLDVDSVIRHDILGQYVAQQADKSAALRRPGAPESLITQLQNAPSRAVSDSIYQIIARDYPESIAQDAVVPLE